MNERGGENATVQRRDDFSIEKATFEAAKNLLKSPKFRSALLFWALGLFLCLFAKAPVQVSEEHQDQYDQLMAQAYSHKGYTELDLELRGALSRLSEVHVWFWRFRPPYDELVPERKREVEAVRQKLRALDAEREKMVVEAKSHVGIWSQNSIDEARDRFWSAFDKGKVFAKRRSFWDTLFMLMSSSRRDESVLSFVLSWVFQVIVNFTLGLLGSLFYFSFAIISLAYSYSPSILSGVAFVSLAILAAASMVVTYLIGIYGCAAGGIYVVGKAAQHAQNQQRLEAEYQRARLGNRNRNDHQHYD